MTINLGGQGPQADLHNPPDNLFHEQQEKLDNEPQNTLSGIDRDAIGYHHIIKLRSVCKSVKDKIDQLPFISVRKEIDEFYQKNIVVDKDKDFITIGINSEIHITELQQKWPRILHDYLQRSTAQDKQALRKDIMALYNRAKFSYNERCEDHNGKVYGKASLLELEFIDVNNERKSGVIVSSM